MAHKIYDNFYLSNEIEDQYNSHIDLQTFFTIDNNLVENPGMTRKINIYSATDNTKVVGMGEGNDDSIEVSFIQKEYVVQTAQNKFEYFDEQEMTDPMLVPVGTQRLGSGLFNKVNADVYKELQKATLTISASAYSFGLFADAVAMLNIEGTDNAPESISAFAFVSPLDMAAIRTALGDLLKYVESFARTGYVGTVAGVNIYTKKDCPSGECIVATSKAVTIFNKKGVEVETPPRSSADANIRKNTIISRKYYIAALTDYTKAVKITIGDRATVVKAPQATDLWDGKTVADIQADDIVVTDDGITGTVKYLEGGFGESGPLAGSGYFIALKVSAYPTGVTYSGTKVGFVPSEGTGLVTLESDGIFVGKITDKNKQKVVVEYALGDLTVQQKYDISKLTYVEAAG